MLSAATYIKFHNCETSQAARSQHRGYASGGAEGGGKFLPEGPLG